MGFLEELDKLDLADDVKERMRQEHLGEIQTKDSELTQLRTRDRRSEVEREVTELSDAGFKNQPGLLKFYRRVLLSDDQEPGTVLLSDADMQLSGDVATGATQKEEKSTADVLREFVKLLPRGEDGKLIFADMLLADDDHGRPDTSEGDPTPEQKSAQAKENLEKITGRPVQRTRKRYQGGVVGVGGDA